jgi:hypothetical protein
MGMQFAGGGCKEGARKRLFELRCAIARINMQVLPLCKVEWRRQT